MPLQQSSMLSWQKNKKNGKIVLDKHFKIVYTMWRAMRCAIHVRMWRNWQTRTVQVRVSNIVKVRILSSAPTMAAVKGCLNAMGR